MTVDHSPASSTKTPPRGWFSASALWARLPDFNRTSPSIRCRRFLDQDSQLPERVHEQEQYGTDVGDIPSSKEESVLYLAYGSNLAAQTFLGMRGIKPLSQISVLVPELHLTFDMPGIPYIEPCFAATALRNPAAPGDFEAESKSESDEDITLVTESELLAEKTGLVESIRESNPDYTGRHWHKPLVGVVYEVTLADYAKIIATEGGGRGYRDTVVDCYPFVDGFKPTDPVPNFPSTEAFKAHTLLSPNTDEKRKKMRIEGKSDPSAVSVRPYNQSVWTIDVPLRPDPEWAQPSARYLNLLRSGAKEHELPFSYQEYLLQLHSFHSTTSRQKVGAVVFGGLWGPVLLSLLKLGRLFAGPDGRMPGWLAAVQNGVQLLMWHAYDYFYKWLFGDGERTINDTQF
ncbi:hypothetical protein N7470_003677 [Penicillium chermesinum]|nr:hypothetical protein N7470_003677 [Penicillium chermesinum]